MKTLYVSDLDGTLLGADMELSPFSSEALNACIQKGMLFTVATARMAYDCVQCLSPLNLNLPGVVSNGVFVYDFQAGNYLHGEILDAPLTIQVLEAFRENRLPCFVYTFSQGCLSLFYNSKELEACTQYYNSQALDSCQEVALVDSLQDAVWGKQAVYISCTGTEAELRPVYQHITRIPGVGCAHYLNIYNGLYCLEVFSGQASKKSGLLRLGSLLEFDELVVFGDNHNDIPMFEIAQRCYVPANGLDEAKAYATAVIEDHNRDGVARFLLREYEGGQTG